MNSKIGILYSTVDGQTLKICNVIKEVLVEKGNSVELFSIDDFDGKIADFDKFIIGSSIRYGKHNSKIIDFIKENKRNSTKPRTPFFRSIQWLENPKEPLRKPILILSNFFKPLIGYPTYLQFLRGNSIIKNILLPTD